MEENQNINQAIDKLGEMLETEEGQEQINSIINMLKSASDDNNADQTEFNSVQGEASSPFDAETIMKAFSLLNKTGASKSYNVTFLEALKPFLKEERRDKLDTAIKLLGMASIFKNLDGFFGKGGN